MKNNIKLVIFDLDNTLTTGPTIWELVHRENGTWHTLGVRYWDEYKQKKFGISSFIRKDVASWRALPLSRLKKAAAKVKYIPQIKTTIQALKRMQVRTALVSCSVDQFAQYVAKKFGIDHVFANPVHVKKGKLTGTVDLKVPGNSKGRITAYLKKCLHLKKREVLAVGDSIHDFPLFRESGISVSFSDGEKKVKAFVDHVISKKNIKKIVDIIKKQH